MATEFANQMRDLCMLLKYLIHMLNIAILPHFFHLKNMLPDNLNKICVHILTLLLAFPISVLLTSSNFTSGRISSDFIWEEMKLKKLWIQAECLTSVFWSAFLSSLYFKHSFAQTFFSMLSPVVEWWCALVLCLLMVVDMTE